MNAVRITRISQMTMLFYDPHTRFCYKNQMVDGTVRWMPRGTWRVSGGLMCSFHMIVELGGCGRAVCSRCNPSRPSPTCPNNGGHLTMNCYI